MAKFCSECGSSLGEAIVHHAEEKVRKVVAKKKRKVSAYGKRYSVEFKKLKKAHPRMKFASLAKKAHKKTKAAMK